MGSKISYLKSVKGTVTSNIEIKQYIELIKSIDSDHYLDVMRLRQIRQNDIEKYKKEKVIVPAVTCSGTFGGNRKASDLIEHSGFIAIDIDDKDNDKSSEKLKEMLICDPYSYAVHLSLSGEGIVVLVKINPDKHLDSFLGLEKYYANQYNVIIDKSCKDVSRCRFLSYDPDIFVNEKANIFKKYLKKKENYTYHKPIIFADDDLSYVVKQICDRGINLVSDYDQWYKVGMSLADFGERGREYFHSVSRIDSKYKRDECDRKFDTFLKDRNRISIGTFFFLAKENGCELQTEQTKTIIHHATIQRRRNKSVKETADLINEFEKIHESVSTKIIEQVYKNTSDQSFVAIDKKDIVPALLRYVKTLRIKYNEITKQFEYDGDFLTDRVLNALYMESKQIISPDLTFTDLRKGIESTSAITYNPIHDYLFKVAESKHNKDCIQDLCDCFEVENMSHALFSKFMKKWLLGLISSAFGMHSVYILVLQGEQNVRKSSFFENLLPDELSQYCTQYELDKDKDSLIALSENWIIYDDEYGGKTKKDEKLMKQLSSLQHKKVRRAYGVYSEQYNRLACLGGTTNEMQIINDPTGNRRIVPMLVKSLDFERYLAIDRDELFSQMYHEWKANPTGFYFSKDDILELNENTESQKTTPLELELFYEYFSIYEGTGNEILYTSSKLLIEIERKSGRKISQRLLGEYLRREGINSTVQRIDSKVQRVFSLIELNHEKKAIGDDPF